MAFIGPYQIYTIDPAELVAHVADLQKMATSVSNALSQASWDKGALALNTDLNSLTTPGVYRAETSTIINSIVNKPPGTTQPFDVVVSRLSGASGVTRQAVTEWTASGPVESSRVSLSGTFQGWAGVLATGASLNTLTRPGLYRADTSTIAKSIIGIPAGTTQPFDVEVRKISNANGIYSQTLSEWNANGPIISRRLSLSGVYPGWTGPVPTANRSRLTTFGDSLTEGGDINGAWPGGASWPAKIQAYLPGVTVTNMGRSGDTTDEILIRAGALELWFGVTGGTIPASGPVGLTTSQPISTRDNRLFTGTLAGVVGTLSTGTGGAWTFTPNATGTPVAVTGKQKFTTATGTYGSDTLVFWGGRNDVSFGKPGKEQTLADHIVGHYQQFLEWVGPQTKRVVLGGVTTASTEHAGDAGYATVKEVNDRLRSMYPGKFIDVQRYLVNQAITDMGLTPTAADTAARAAGEIPPQLYASGDTIHFSQTTAAALAQYLFAPYLLGKGWL